ncbi:7TM chemoreceptor [Ancylostoma ceylanicum]|uniref:7TM chemoreceptor n=1 Tax=Ancylostoma ceylanicum TaxID=53326 RepID=A0A0D6M1J4_9BILA|nr:7TM chemoreceptor [Ancylostoma ceylanicum]
MKPPCRFVVAGDSLGYVPLGPAKFLNMPRLVLFCTSLMLTLDIYSFMTIAMCMVYKYLTLIENSPSEKRLLVGIALFFLIPLSTGIALLIYDPDYAELYAILERLRPESELSRYGKYSGLPNVKSIYVMYLIIVICSIGVSSYVVMITTGLKIRRHVLKNHSAMSPQNARIFKLMIKALIIQSFMPVFFSFPTKILYFSAQFGALHSMTAEYLMFAMSPVVSIVDPCITMYFVLPYRRHIMRKLGLEKKVSKISTVEVEQQSGASDPHDRSCSVVIRLLEQKKKGKQKKTNGSIEFSVRENIWVLPHRNKFGLLLRHFILQLNILEQC